MTTQSKILSLESLRGVAALSVALFHFRVNSHFENDFISHAWLMVDFFFVLSGFVISLNYQSRIVSFRDLANFQLRRFFRLYPLHFLMLIVFLGIELLKYFAASHLQYPTRVEAFAQNDMGAFASNLFLLQNFTHAALTWNYPSWSISAEFYVYIFFALVVLFCRGRGGFVSIVSLLVVLCSFVFVWDSGMHSVSPSGPIRCAFSFFLGVLVFNAYEKLENRHTIQTSFFATLLLFVSCIGVAFTGSDKYGPSVMMPLLFGATVLVLVLTDTNTRLVRMLNNRALVYLGTISYGIYMIHAAVWWVFVQLSKFLFDAQTLPLPGGNAKIILDDPIVASVMTIVGVIIILLLSHLSYVFVEMRFNKFRTKFLM